MTRERRGIALFAAIALLGLVALLVGGALAALRLASRSSAFANTDAVLSNAADFAITSVAMNARQLGLDTLPLGVGRTIVPIPSSSNGVSPTVVATRLAGDAIWLVAGVAQNGLAGGQRRINLVARWRSPAPLPSTALTARGNIRLSAGAMLGVDTTGDVDCRAPPPADVSLAPGAVVIGATGTSVSTPTASDSTTYLLAPSQLAQIATHVTYVAGDTTITGGAFQGILIVDGVLTIAGPYTVTGLVIARRSIVATSGGLVIVGAMMSFAPVQTSVPAIDVGSSNIRYSRCAITAAIRRSIPLRPVRERSWAELF